MYILKLVPCLHSRLEVYDLTGASTRVPPRSQGIVLWHCHWLRLNLLYGLWLTFVTKEWYIKGTNLSNFE